MQGRLNRPVTVYLQSCPSLPLPSLIMPFLHTHFEWKTQFCNVSNGTQIHYRHSLTYEISSYLTAHLSWFKKVEEKEITFLKREPNFSFRG